MAVKIRIELNRTESSLFGVAQFTFQTAYLDDQIELFRFYLSDRASVISVLFVSTKFVKPLAFG